MRQARPRGMTLTELLIVVMVMVILIGAALPVMKTSMEERRLREATRQLVTYVQVAKAQAAETGREVALWLEVETLPEAGIANAPFARRVFLAESPLPYAGDMAGARLSIDFSETGGVRTYWADADGFSSSLAVVVQEGDRLKFDFKGPTYTITRITSPLESTPHPPSKPPFRVFFNVASGQPNPPKVSLQYQIFRQPMKSMSNPLELPNGTLIDLSNSGFGLADRSFAGANWAGPLMIVFSPTGSVFRASWHNGVNLTTVNPTETTHLLIGSTAAYLEAGLNSTVADPYNKNLEDTSNFWVSIGHFSGEVATAQNPWLWDTNFATSLARAREFAQQRKNVGGR